MYCTSCGKEIANDSKFCVYCGARCDETTEPVRVPIVPKENRPQYDTVQSSRPKKKAKQKKNLFIIIILAAVVIALAFAVFVFIKHEKSTSQKQEEQSTIIDDNNSKVTDYESEETETGEVEYDDAEMDEENESSVEVEEDESEEDDEDEYILPNSGSEYISKSDLKGLSEWEVRVARNEIMARHGRKFKDEALQDYFDSCSWYSGTIEPEEFDNNYAQICNKYEIKNAETIQSYEKDKGYNQ